MRFMMIVKGDESFDRSGPPPAALMAAIDQYGQDAAREGKLVSFGGLRRTAEGARVRITKGKIVTTDGPFTETKEVIGGFSVMNLASREEAIQEAIKFMELHRIHWPEWEGETEVRPMYEEGEPL
ncbi:MAG TPA: YciI family protein [Gemmatimonadaceae bacterium]|nr:YciI family protein [Gemmatimonadaceae bacterium]